MSVSDTDIQTSFGYSRTNVSYGISGAPGIILGGGYATEEEAETDPAIVIVSPVRVTIQPYLTEESSVDGVSLNGVATDPSKTITVAVMDINGVVIGSDSDYTPGDIIDVTQSQSVVGESVPSYISWYGRSVSVDGDIIAIGAPGFTYAGTSSQGKIFVLQRALGVWGYNAIIDCPDAPTGDNSYFGDCVSVSGDTLVTGCKGNDTYYVFVYNLLTSAWELEQSITGTFDVNNYSQVRIDGDTIVFGDINTGSAHVWKRTGTTWASEQILTGTFDFGYDVDIDGDNIIVGEPSYVNGSYTAGRVHVYTRSGSTWSIEQSIDIDPYVGTFTDKSFGTSVSISGDSIVGGTYYLGETFVFTRSGVTWTFEQEFNAVLQPATPQNVHIHYAVIDGDTIVAGSASENTKQGAVYLWTRSGSTWSQDSKLEADDGLANDSFGNSVYINGTDIVIGADSVDYDANISSGAVYVTDTLGAPAIKTTTFEMSGTVLVPIGWIELDPGAIVAISGTNLSYVDGGAGEDYILDDDDGFLIIGFKVGDRVWTFGATTDGNNLSGAIITRIEDGKIYFASGTISLSESFPTIGIVLSDEGGGSLLDFTGITLTGGGKMLIRNSAYHNTVTSPVVLLQHHILEVL